MVPHPLPSLMLDRHKEKKDKEKKEGDSYCYCVVYLTRERGMREEVSNIQIDR
jgi:hypothetical protein